MILSKNVKSIIFFMMIICILSLVTVSISKVFYAPYCQTSTYYASIQDIAKPGQNSFTTSQIKNCLMQNGFRNIKRLRLDDKGIWRALVEFEKCHFLISVDYSGAVSIQNERRKHDCF